MEHLIASIAGFLCTMSFLPQVMKIARTRQTKDLSLVTFLMFAAGVLLWLVYGLMIDEMPIIIANAVALVMAIVILTLKIKYK